MLTWAIIFLVIAVVAGVFGFTGISAAASGIARILFFIFLVVFIVTLIWGSRFDRACERTGVRLVQPAYLGRGMDAWDLSSSGGRSGSPSAMFERTGKDRLRWAGTEQKETGSS